MFYINNISHKAFMTGQCKEVILGGFGIISPVGVIINRVYIPARFVNSALIHFILPYIPAGNYDIIVVNGDKKQYICRQAISITDPDVSLDVGSLGSSALPLVLPPRVAEVAPSSIVRQVVAIRRYNTPATVYSQPDGQTVASKSADQSVIPTEPVQALVIHSTPLTGAVLDTPFGKFSN